MFWQLLLPATAAASPPADDCRPSLALHGPPSTADGKSTILFKPSCGSLDTNENTFAVFQSLTNPASGPGTDSDVDTVSEWVPGSITEDAIAVDVHPDSDIITVAASSRDGHPIFHTLNLSATSTNQKAQCQLAAQSLEARADCDKCHAPLCQESCQPPLQQSCSFYTNCAEASLHCGPEGYPLRYGDKICNVFLDRLPHFSNPTGQDWVLKVLTCLQEALLPALNEQCELTCQQLFDTAFKSHPACYADSGVCFLPLQDLVQIVIAVGSDIVYGPALEQALSLGGHCVDQYIVEVDEAIDEAKEAGDFAKRILYEGVKKFLQGIA